MADASAAERVATETRVIALERVPRAVASSPFARFDVERALDEVARALEETLGRVAPERSAPDLALVGEDGSPVPGPYPGFELVTGRSGWRAMRVGETDVARNGWRLRSGVPALLHHGDVIETPDGVFEVVARDGAARRLVELGRVGCASVPADGIEHVFALEPEGAPVAVAFDDATARALLDVVLGGAGDAPFTRSALAEVDRAVVDWLVRRAMHAACAAIAAPALALSERPRASGELAWFVGALRIGTYWGAAYLGLSDRAAAALAELLPRRPARPASAALSGARLATSLQVPVGSAAALDLAALAPGDLVVARGARFREAEGLAGPARLVLGGTEGVRVRIELRERVLRLRRDGRAREEVEEMYDESASTAGDEAWAGMLGRARVDVSIEIARRSLTVAELAALGRGGVIELEAPVSAVVTVLAGGAAVARGELVEVDGSLGVRITSIGGDHVVES